MREQFREEYLNLSDEEKAQLKEERQAKRQEKGAAMQEFTGLSREQMREARQNGQTMGEILENQGKLYEDAENFLTERANLII